MHAGEYMIAHGYHKDLLFFSVLESIQAYHQHVCAVPSGDSAGCVCAHWVSSLVPAVSRIRDYTDGDETRYAPAKLAEVLSEISPDALLNCYQWQRRYGGKKDALTTLHAFLTVADLDDPAHRTLAEEATDSLSRSILQRRKRDASRVSRDSPGETDVPSEFQQKIPPSTPGQEDQPAFNVERPKGLPRPASYPPSRFKDYLQALRRKFMSYDKASVKSWIAYWSQKGRQVEVYHAVMQEIERGRYLEVYDEMVELASTHYGWEHAYGWLVKAQAESYGWWQYFSSEEDARRRWAMVRERYPERWYDFIRDSLEEAGKRSRGGVALSHYMWVRLIQYLLVVQQPAQAKRLIEVMVTDSLVFVPFQSVESSAGVES
jgi:hypothetical protein